MVTQGELEGGCRVVNERRRWFVYADQLQPAQMPATDGHQHVADVNEALRTELAAARAAASTAEEANRLLTASQANVDTAFNEYRKATDESIALANEYRALLDRYSSAAAGFRSSAEGFAAALSNYRDILALLMTPDDLSSLDEHPTR
jgi:hypothetical protein